MACNVSKVPGAGNSKIELRFQFNVFIAGFFAERRPYDENYLNHLDPGKIVFFGFSKRSQSPPFTADTPSHCRFPEYTCCLKRNPKADNVASPAPFWYLSCRKKF